MFWLFTAVALSACTTTPVPQADPRLAWVDLSTVSGKLVMADRLDDRRWPDGRYFQVTPGEHELIVRFDFEVYGGIGFNTDTFERKCYITLRYEHFQAGQRYRVEAREIGLRPSARLYDSQRQIVAEDSHINCL